MGERQRHSGSAFVSKVHHGRCLNARHFGSSCQSCVDSCPAGALARQGDSIDFESERCVGCGLCLSICPTEVFSSEQWSEDQLIDVIRKRQGESLSLFCRQATIGEVEGKEQAVRAGVCLGSLSPSFLFEIARERGVTLQCACIDECDERIGIEMAKGNLALANAWLRAQGFDQAVSLEQKDEPVVVRDEVPQGSGSAIVRKRQAFCSGRTAVRKRRQRKDPLENRQPLTMPAGRRVPLVGFIAKGAPLSSVVADIRHSETSYEPLTNAYRKKIGHHVPTALMRLRALWGDTSEAEDAAYFPGVQIDTERCAGCGVCAQFCSTGALDVCQGGDSYHMLHTPGLCADCGLCELACTTETLRRTYVKQHDPFSSHEVFTAESHACVKCGSTVVRDGETHCFWCASDDMQALITSAKMSLSQDDAMQGEQ